MSCTDWWLAFQPKTRHSGPNFCHYPLIFSPNDAQYVCRQYLHHRKPITANEFQWEFHVCVSKTQQQLAIWCALTGLRMSNPFWTTNNANQSSKLYCTPNWMTRNNQQAETQTTSNSHCLVEILMWGHYFLNGLCNILEVTDRQLYKNFLHWV